MALTDATGAVVQRYTYDSFGNLTSQTGSVVQPYQFSTKRMDPGSGLVDFGARWYDPQVGRFISPDPAGFVDGANLYTYVGNDPVNFIDPVGLAGMSFALTDVKKLADMGNALEAHRGRVRFRTITRANGRSYWVCSGRQGAFPLAPGAYRLDNPAVAPYLNAGAAARGAVRFQGAGGLTVLLVTVQDVVNQLGAGRSLTDPAFLGHTAVDVAEGLASGALGAGAGAIATLYSGGNPAVGIATGVVVSKGIGTGLDHLERWIIARLTTGSSESQ